MRLGVGPAEADMPPPFFSLLDVVSNEGDAPALVLRT